MVKELVAEGYFVRAFGRNEAVGQSLVSDQVEFFKGDLSSKQAVEEACKGVEMVVQLELIHCLGALGEFLPS